MPIPKKKVLIFIDWFLPGYKAGGPVRSCANLIDHLQDSFDFSIVTRDTDYCETLPYPTVQSDSWNTLENGVRVYYFSQKNLTRKNIFNLLKSETYDVVYLNGIYSPYFTLLPLYFLKKKKIKNIIVAARGMLARSAVNVKKNKKKVFLAVIKTLKLFKGVTFHATTEEEEKDIKAHFSNARIILAPNLPKKTAAAEAALKEKEAGKVKLVNIARIAPEKNLLYALQVLMKVKSNVEFNIYGPIYNEEYWKKCLEIIKRMPPNIHIRYRGSTESEKVNEILSSHHFMLMPTLGENFGHIILESLCAGCPVIISDQTPWKNLDAVKAGWDVPLNEQEKLIDIIEKCAAMSAEEYNEWSKSALNYCREVTENEEILARNIRLFA